jgi:hypothetical protein
MFELIAFMEECYFELFVMIAIKVDCFLEADLVVGGYGVLEIFLHFLALVPTFCASSIYFLFVCGIQV